MLLELETLVSRKMKEQYLTKQHVRIRMQVEEKPKEESKSQQKLWGRKGLMAKNCKKWRTGACSFTDSPDCVGPTNPCAETCLEYEETETPGTEQREPDSTRPFSNENSNPKTEIKPESSQTPDSRQNLDISKGTLTHA